MAPWGTTAEMERSSDASTEVTTLIYQSDRYDLNRQNTLPQNP